MGKRIRFAAAILVFFVIGFGIFCGLSEILRQKTGGKSDMIHGLYELEENSVDVLCLGSSHGYSSIQANTLWQEYGMTAYVMCNPRQTVAQSYYMLREALKYQKPKALLMETYYFFCGDLYTDEASLRFAFDGMRPSKLKLEALNKMLADKPWKEKFSYLVPFVKYHGRWEELKDSDFEHWTFLHGSILGAEVYPMEEPVLPQEKVELPDLVYEYFEKIVALCEQEGIPIVMYAAPYGYENGVTAGYMRKQGMNYTMEEYFEKLGIPFFFFQKDNAAGLDYAADFRDFAHLNIYGADKITKYLGTYLAENYELEDHREDPAYASWWEDYRKYDAIREKRTNN